MQKITTIKALELIKQSKGKTFSVVFTKKDNSLRLLNGRLGVTKHLTGKGLSYNPETRGLLNVYDMKAKGYRMVTISTIQGLKINKQEYVVTDQIETVEIVSFWTKVLSFFKGGI